MSDLILCRACFKHLSKFQFLERFWSIEFKRQAICNPCRREQIKRARVLGVKRSLTNKISKYELTLKEYLDLFENQGGVCAICRQAKTLGIDHDHLTGKVRGLLCRGCNTALGHMYDKPQSLRAAAAYLENTNA